MVGNNMVEDIFLENEGVFVLLDLLQVSSARCQAYCYSLYLKVSPKNMRGLVLGVLVDLCDNPKV